MKTRSLLMMLLLALFAGGTATAQVAVTVGNQVTDEASIVSGKAYLIKYTSMTGTPYIYDAGQTTPLQAPSTQNSPTAACVFYFISDGNGAYKLENAYTGNYWPAPTGNERLYPTTAANAGSWAISISSGTATMTCTNGGTTYGLDRLTPDVVGWSSRKTVEIYEVSTADLATTSSYSEFSGKDIDVSTTEASSLSEGQWYAMFDRGAYHGYLYENTSSHTLYNTNTVPSGSATSAAKYLVRLLNAGNNKYYLQTGFGNYFGNITHSEAVPVTPIGSNAITIGKINDTDGHFYLQSAAGVVLDANTTYYGDASVVGWETTIPTSTGGNNDWAFYPVEFVESWAPTASEVYTINNTNTSRGALIYNSENPKYVWSSGKSGTFDASNANSQWVICPSGTANQYYLYNVGAGKFAIPSGTTSTASWVFSPDAVAVEFITQSDGTKKIKTATTDTYAAVSNGYNGPIINYNDVGGNFTITKVDGTDASTAVTTAVNRLVDNQTAASAVPASGSDTWYIIRIKTHGTYADKYVFPAASEITYNGTNYPLTFDHGANIRPAIDDVTYYTRISNENGNYYWQMPNGKYLYGDNNKFPISTTTKSNFAMDYTSGSGFRMWGSSRYAVPYLLNSQYFIGETVSTGNAYYDLYPIDLATAGLAAWQVICDAAPESQQISCSRSDVSGLTSVYKNGYIFLPSSVTPVGTDFNLDGATDVAVDATNHTVTFTYDPNLAMVEGGVTVEQGWQTAGRDGEVMLLRVTAKPFKDATNTTMTVSLKDGSEANISTLKLYEASSNSPEIYSTGSGAPTKTEVATASISGSTATFNIGNLTAGTHYYWIGATVKSDATLGAVLDAAVTGITYTCNSNETTLDLTSVGDPADRGAMIFNAHSYPFLPRDNGSRVYRIPAMAVADDGSIVVAADKRYDSYTDIGGGHVIDIVVRRSTDGGKTWSEPVTIAKGVGTADNSRCGYGDPSLVKGKDGKIYCLFAAGNLGYFYGQKHICMSTSTDNGVTWSSSESNPPVDIFATGAIQNATGVGAAGGYGLYDYFVTSGKGLYTSDGILMYLIPAQTLTADNYTKADGTYWGASSDDYLFYSTDDGATWYFSETPMIIGGDEAKVIEMNDGSLFGSIRKGGPRRFNTATYTKNNDGTLNFTYGTQWDNNQLHQDSQNNQDILYYQRETTEGKTDVIIHSITTGNHVNFKLYYSTDKGINWTEFLNVQTKGTRYVTMDKNPTNGSLYLLFEDQSLNSAGGYTDYNHYPLNFIEITRDQLVALIPALNEYAIPEYLETTVVKNTVYQTSTGCDSYGAFSGTGTGHWARTWTSNATSGKADLTVSTESGYGFDKATVLGTRVMTLKPSANGATDTYTITAPAGYLISSYTIGGAVYTSGTYRITAADGTTTGDITSTTTPTNITVNNVNTSSTTFTFYGASQNNWFAITNFTITLAKPLKLNAVGDKSYATLYLPVDVTTDANTKAYYITTTNSTGADKGVATLTAVGNEGHDIPAMTAVVLVNSTGATGTVLDVTSGLSPVVTEADNLLKGTLVNMSLDLSDVSNYYSLGVNEGKVGFYKYNKGGVTTITLGANKAYLEVSGSTPSKGFEFGFGETNAIEGLSPDPSPKGEGSDVYNLQGQRVNTLKRGIYIVNGKKVVIK